MAGKERRVTFTVPSAESPNGGLRVGATVADNEALAERVRTETALRVFDDLKPPYSTIVADPPWPHKGFAGSVGRGGFFAGAAERSKVKVDPLPYSSMPVDDIAALPVHSLSARGALFLWTTNAYIKDAFRIIDTWGYRYRQTLVWHKTGNPLSLGGTVAPNHAEFLLVAAKGTVGWIGRAESSIITAQKPNAHSVKPACFLDLVERVAPGPYLELFAREQRLGWDSWGHGYEGVA